jgi:hypothetical protein
MSDIDISKEIKELSNRWLAADIKDVKTVADINHGYCADFATVLWEKFRNHGVSVQGIYAKEDLLRFPASNERFAALVQSGEAGHTFIEYQSRFYDAETPNGVPNPYDLPVFSRALEEHENLIEQNNLRSTSIGGDCGIER